MIWSEIFEHKTENQAIVLLNSQNKDNNTRIWLLSMLLSSVQCYSFSGSPADLLPTLNSAYNYEELQRFWYIVRDWTGEPSKLGEHTNQTDYISKEIEDKFHEARQFVLPNESVKTFQTHMDDLMQKIVGPEELEMKKIKGEEPMRVEKFFEFAKALLSTLRIEKKSYDLQAVSLRLN